MHLWQDKNKRPERGSILMEAVICLPVLLLLSLGVAQFAHIWLCRTMVHYAAYCGARATLTAPAGAENELRWARKAAEVACSPIAFMNPTAAADFGLPGISNMDGVQGGVLEGNGGVRFESADHSEEILTVELLSGSSVPSQFHRGVKVSMKVPLMFPFAGPVIGRTMVLFQNGRFSPGAGEGSVMDGDIFPRITLQETAYIVKPFISTWSQD